MSINITQLLYPVLRPVALLVIFQVEPRRVNVFISIQPDINGKQSFFFFLKKLPLHSDSFRRFQAQDAI